jgi:hypothetical protein
MGAREKNRYLFVLIATVLLVVIACSGCLSLTCTYLPSSVLTDGWHENTAFRTTGSQFLGFEQWCSTTYEITGNYPASLTVTTLKTMVLTNEAELQKKTTQTIEDTFQERITLQVNSTGERTLGNTHRTRYVVYDGIDTTSQETVKIIGETWNCGTTGTSLLCIGLAYITNHNNPTIQNTDQWEKIVSDLSGTIENYNGEYGLLYSMTCH